MQLGIKGASNMKKAYEKPALVKAGALAASTASATKPPISY